MTIWMPGHSKLLKEFPGFGALRARPPPRQAQTRRDASLLRDFSAPRPRPIHRILGKELDVNSRVGGRDTVRKDACGGFPG